MKILSEVLYIMKKQAVPYLFLATDYFKQENLFPDNIRIQLWGPQHKTRMWICCCKSRGGQEDDWRAGAPLLGRQVERTEVIQPREESRETLQHLLKPKGSYKKAEEGLFTLME